jgi:hypothetical protein
MKGQLPVKTPEQYLGRLDEPRRSEVTRLDRLIQATLPHLERCIVSGLLSYGPVHYRYASGREGDTARLSIASNASSISLYAFAADEKGWVAERYRTRLPKARIGKSCVRFKRLDDLDLETLKALLREASFTAFPAHGGEVREKAPARSAPRPPKRGATTRRTSQR